MILAPAELDRLEKLYLERSDSIDASSYAVRDLIEMARAAVEVDAVLKEIGYSGKAVVINFNGRSYHILNSGDYKALIENLVEAREDAERLRAALRECHQWMVADRLRLRAERIAKALNGEKS
jgi:hypothetical protein